MYAYADSEMKRKALEHADAVHGDTSSEIAIWENNEEMILRLCGLK